MRSNFHYQGLEKPSAAAASIMEELRRTDEELEMKRRLMEEKRIEQQILKEQMQQKGQHQDRRLKQEFYEDTPKSKGGNYGSNNDFFSKFSNNNREQDKKSMYKNMLDKQIEHKRQQSTEKLRREQLADEAWNNIMKSKPQGDNKSYSPSSGQQGQSRVRDSSIQTNSRSNNDITRYPKPAKVPQLIGYSDQQQRLKKLKQQRNKQYFRELEQQIEEDKRRKQEQKKLRRQAKIEAHEARFGGNSRRSQQKVQPSQKVNKTQYDSNTQAKYALQKYEEEQKVLRQKYRKGLIDVEQYQKRMRLLEALHGRKDELIKIKQTQDNFYQRNNQYIKTQEQPEERQMHISNVPSISNLPRPMGNKVETSQNSSRHNIRSSRHYEQSLMQQPTEYYPIYPPSQHVSSQVYNQQKPLPNTNPTPNIDPLHYASILQQNQLQMFQKMMDGMKQIITTTLMYDRKKKQNQVIERPQINTIESEEYRTNPREIPIRQLRSPDLTKINSPRHLMQPSISLENIKMAYESIDDSKNFFRKLPKVKGFKKFDYVQKMGGSTLQIPSTSCFVTNTDGFQKLQKSFQKDLIVYKQLQLNQQIENIKDEKPYFKKKPNPIQIQTATFKNLGVERKQYQSKQSIQQNYQSETNNKYELKLNQPGKWQKKQFKSPKIDQPRSSKKQHKQSDYKPVIKRNSLQEQFSQNVEERIKLPTFLQLNDMTQLRKELKKQVEIVEQQEEERPAILQRSTYEAKKPVIIINEPQQESYPSYRVPEMKPMYYEQSHIGSNIGSQSELDQYMRPHQSSSNKLKKYQTVDVYGIESSLNAESIYQQSLAPKIDTNVLKLSRKKMSQIKKNKDNLLFDFMSLSEPNKYQHQIRPQSPRGYEQQITERIQQDEYIPKKKPQSRYSTFKQQDQHLQSQTILSKFQDSNIKDHSQLNYSKEQSNITSLSQARKKAKQIRNKDKKQSSLISLDTLEKLQREIKRKQPIEQVINESKRSSQPPSLVKNPKQLLGMLQDMIVDEEDEEYPEVFDSYHQ